MGERLDLGGVQGPGARQSTLGVKHERVAMQPGPRADMQAELAEAHTAMRMASEAMAEARTHIGVLEADVVRHAQNASDLWSALRAMIAWSKEWPASDREGDAVESPDEVHAAGALLLALEDEYRRPEPVLCPECVAGKHPNCTKVVPVDDGDKVTPCGCTDESHVAEEGPA